MPVGCLGGSTRATTDSTLYLNNGQVQEPGSEASRQAETIAVMQHTLLVQIFRVDSESSLSCATCSSFSPVCCQTESGWAVLSQVVQANSQCVWNQPLVRAINSLSFQGYVCPGILVTLTDGDNIKVLEECWHKHTLISPSGFKIYRLGLSGGCTVTPFNQGPSPSLPDAICAILSSLKSSNTVANMENIIAKIKTDFRDIPVPKDFVNLIHKTLGALIKARKVYYTGKGYFLVVPENNSVTRQSWHDQFKQFAIRSPQKGIDNSSQTEANIYRPHEQNGHSMRQGPNQDWQLSPGATGLGTGGSASPYYGLTSKQSHQPVTKAQSLSPSNNNNVTPYKVSPRGAQERESPVYGTHSSSNNSNANDISINSEESLPESPQSPNNSSNLERSQSFRMSKKSQKITAKGGSLRLSKRDALTFKEDNDNTQNEEAEVEQERDSPEPKKMERKNSVLGRLFGRKKSSGSPKKEILTFCAQFPPPDLIENMKMTAHLSQTAETQTPPQRKKSTRPPIPTPEDLKLRSALVSPTVSTTQVRNGPNGNFVVYERSNHVNGKSPSPPNVTKQTPLSPNLSMRPLPKSPPPLYSQNDSSMKQNHETSYRQPDTYGHGAGHIYSQPNLYGVAKPPPPAYSSAPPYRAKDSISPSPTKPAMATTNGYNTKAGSPQKQVHFATSPRSSERDSPSQLLGIRSSPSCLSQNFRSNSNSDGGSTNGSSSLSGPSSIDSVLYDDTLVVIEKSNHELEQRLGRNDKHHPNSVNRTQISNNRVDTIHNNRHLDQEIIYEENMSDMSRSSSVSTLKPDYAPDHPSLSDLGSIADLSAKFQSLTARKLMAGLSISSIDTLLEVNAAHDSNPKLSILNESTETIDFGVI